MSIKRTSVFALALIVFLMSISCCAFAESEWTCSNCGTEKLTGKFCFNCGNPSPSQSWICPNCGRTNQMQFCPDCGTSRDAAQQTGGQGGEALQPLDPLTLDDLMTPARMIDMMNACIASNSEQIAGQISMDAAELFGECYLYDTESVSEFFSFGNEAWDIEMYFYYPGVQTPDPNAEADLLAMAVAGSHDETVTKKEVVFSSVLTILQQVDPELDVEAAFALILNQVPDSQYVGNGYIMTYKQSDDGNDTQLLIERA